MTQKFIDIVFDGPPGPNPGRFVEVENESGESICAGEWIDRGDGMWALRIANADAADTSMHSGAVDVREAFEEIRSALDETYGFSSTSPRGQENINFVSGRLDDIERAYSSVRPYAGDAQMTVSGEKLVDMAEPFWLKDAQKEGEFFDVNGFSRALLATVHAPTAIAPDLEDEQRVALEAAVRVLGDGNHNRAYAMVIAAMLSESALAANSINSAATRAQGA